MEKLLKLTELQDSKLKVKNISNEELKKIVGGREPVAPTTCPATFCTVGNWDDCGGARTM